ncbi:DUF4270 domain-containing protein [Flavobacterium sp. SM2513]|uniref:DUF4270 domain-containing protein n=1 Tax=Flavobacterium sp. SM2513 TaxID=3424766 RepID=UPI003D7F5580
MNKISFYGIATALFLSALLFSSCDQDFSEMGSGIVDDDHFAFKPDTTSTVRAYSQATGVMQSNNLLSSFLPPNALGVYTNSFFGKVKANYVTQLELSTVNPVFSSEYNPVLDSVVLTIPYFSTKTTSTDQVVTYALDSIKGSGTINLKVFESGYVINSLNPSDNFQTTQRYYTDQNSIFNDNKIGSMLNNSSDTKQNSAFKPSNEAIVKLKVDRGLKTIVPSELERQLSPRMQLKLDKAFFQEKIMNAPAGKLLNNSVFKEYFRGIYFQVDEVASDLLMQLDFSRGNITLHYQQYASVIDGVPVTYTDSPDDSYGGLPKLEAKTFVLNMTGSYVSLLETQNSNLYANAILNPNRTVGDSRIFLKGGEGSIAVIDLFGPDNFGSDGMTGIPDGVADELNIIRNNGWLINEANLTFYIDKDAMSNVPEPQRLYLYDLKNRTPLVDWISDGTSSSVEPNKNKIIHDGIIQTTDSRGVKYRIRITNHIRNLIRKDSTNVRLGLSVTEAIVLSENFKLKEPKIIPGAFPQSPEFTIDRVPAASLFNPLGTILFGNNIAPGSANYAKRLKLEIYYTKPN